MLYESSKMWLTLQLRAHFGWTRAITILVTEPKEWPKFVTTERIFLKQIIEAKLRRILNIILLSRKYVSILGIVAGKFILLFFRTDGFSENLIKQHLL